MATANPDLDEALHAELGVLHRRIPEDQLGPGWVNRRPVSLVKGNVLINQDGPPGDIALDIA